MISIKKALYALGILSLLCAPTFAQKQASIWYFGNRIGLDFNTGETRLTRTFPGQHADEVDEGHATVSDENGNFLFYTNGENIWDKNAAVMQNGAGLMGHWSATQCATIFPLPGSTKTSALSKYVVLTTPVSGSGATGIRYNIVDMDPASNGGYATGALMSKNNAMPTAPSSTEALASCPHWDGKQEWVVGHGDASNTFYAWRVSADAAGNITVSAPVTSSIGAAVSGVVMMKFNNCFNKLAVAEHTTSNLQVFSFNNQTGAVTVYDANPARVNGVLSLNVSNTVAGSTGAIQGNYGVEFSPNGRYLFVSQSGQLFPAGTQRSQRLYRYDLTANAAANPTTALINASRTTLFTREGTDNGHRIGHIQLAPNGRIYMTHMYAFNSVDGAKLSVIGSPNDPAHNFSAESIVWPAGGGVRSSMGLPSFHKGFLAGSASISAADSTSGTSISNLGEICAGIATMFENKYTGTGINYTWDVNARPSTAATAPNYGTSDGGAKAYHRYTVAGDYVVVTTVEDAVCNYIVRDTARIKVNPVTNVTATAACSSANINLNITSTPTTGKTYVWYRDAAMTLPFATGASITDAGVVPNPGTVSPVYYVKEVASATMSTPTTSTVTNFTTANGNVINGRPSLASSSTNKAVSTIVLSSPGTLNSARFAITGGDWGCGTVNYAWRLMRGATVVASGTTSASSCKNVTYSNPWVQTGDDLNLTINQNLTAGTYSLEVWYTTGSTVGGNIIDIDQSGATNNSIAGFISNSGPYANRISVTNASIPVPVNKICSYPAVVSVVCSLPVTFVNFTVQKSGSSALLNWSTAKEENNSHFVVERSVNGATYEEISVVAGKGTKYSLSHYSYTDANPVNGTAYYRIRQVDYNGEGTATDPRSLSFTVSPVVDMVIKPNPNNGQFIVELATEGTQAINLQIVSTLGTIVWQETFSTEGFVSKQLELSDIAPGVYIVKAGGFAQKVVIK